MKLYLSSYKLGNQADVLLSLFPAGSRRTIGYIANALDSHVNPPSWIAESIASDVAEITAAGVEIEPIDLKEYFGQTELLHKKLSALGGIWVRGGNTFVLRQAMALSGLDELVREYFQNSKDFVYGGYSAGICVLAPSLQGLSIVDDPNVFPYDLKETIWEGLGILNYLILPHYRSNHPESPLIEQEVAYCQKHGIAFKTLRDGEVIIV